jgi:hypothetical protein
MQLVLALVEKPAARRHPERIQAALQLLKDFWDQECEPLRRAMVAAGRVDDQFLPQAERDPLFLGVRAQKISVTVSAATRWPHRPRAACS